jgi:uncharacterized membrane protein
MNFAYLHLALNHLPILTLPMALIFYIFAIYKKNQEFEKFSLLIIVITAATVIPAYLTGEPAEEMIEHLPGIAENLVKDHEEMAEVAFILTLIAGIFSLFTLLFSQKFQILKKHAGKVIISLSVLALVFLAIAAKKGGEIRHTEIRPEGISKTLPYYNEDKDTNENED